MEVGVGAGPDAFASAGVAGLEVAAGCAGAAVVASDDEASPTTETAFPDTVTGAVTVTIA